MRQVERHGSGTLTGEPPAALCSATADFEDIPAADVAEQARRTLPKPLRTPAEVGIAEELTVFDLVIRGISVPPRSGGLDGLRNPCCPSFDRFVDRDRLLS